MNRTHIIVGILLVVVLSCAQVWAQVDPGFKFHLYENGVLVGEVFAPDRPAGATVYTEHWVLYKNYRYPGPLFVGELLVAPMPSLQNYADTSDFLAHSARNQRVAKYIEVQAEEFDALPVNR